MSVPRRFLALLGALSALGALPAWGAQWKVEPSLSVAETYTDNVALATDADKRADWITEITPRIALTADSARVKFRAFYAPLLIYYLKATDDNRAYNRLDATLSAELAEETLFVDAGATVDQYNVSLQGPLTTSSVNTTDNLATTGTSYVSPYVRHDFGMLAKAEARYTYSVWNSDSQDSFANSDANRVNLRIESGPEYKQFTWNGTYLGERIQYENQQTIDTEASAVNARWLVTPLVGMTASAGYENYDSRVSGVGSEFKGPSWSVGFDWSPSPRTRLAATGGERFFGNTGSLDFSHRSRFTTWGASYHEDITTTRTQFFVPATASTSTYLDSLYSSRFPDAATRQKEVQEFIARTGLPPDLSAPVDFFTTQLYLLKRWLASVGFLGVSNVVIANLFKETRELLVSDTTLPGTGDFTSSNNLWQTGASLVWNWRMSARNTWTLSTSYRRNEFPGTGRIDRLGFLRMSIARRLRPNLFGSVSYRWQEDDSNQDAFDFTENAVYATLQVNF